MGHKTPKKRANDRNLPHSVTLPSRIGGIRMDNFGHVTKGTIKKQVPFLFHEGETAGAVISQTQSNRGRLSW